MSARISMLCYTVRCSRGSDQSLSDMQSNLT